MEQNKIVKISKTLSYLLRHKPEAAGLILDAQGWVNVADLLEAFKKHYFTITLEELREVVAKNDKKRFAFSEDELQIRASQGHSVEIDLAYQNSEPPEILFHGTATRFLESIREKGLIKQNRHHVHLSKDKETAQKVGSRHGSPVVLQIKAKEMFEKGYQFYISENGVWLTETVPVEFLVFPDN